MINKKNKTIIYVNFSPYENAGNILDFILEEFENVILFSFNFHKLGKNQKPSTMQIFKKGNLINSHPLFQLSFPSSLVFLMLPLRSFIMLFQLIVNTFKIKKTYKKIDIYFTVNAYTAWIGNMLRTFKLVEKTVFWVWDYYPPLHENKLVSLMLWLYWQFDKIGSQSDRLVFLNKRLQDLRKDIGIFPREKNYPIVPIGTDPKKIIYKNQKDMSVTIGFLGVIKKTQGLDLIFDNASKIVDSFPDITLKVIGSGPDLEYFKKRAKKTSFNAKFYGFVPGKKDVDKILSECTIGIALYLPEKSNVSNYTDNSKIKDYLCYGLPVITTNIPSSEEVKRKKAGIIINYYKPQEFINAIKIITSNYKNFQRNAKILSEKYYFKKIYPEIFKFN
ncbi:glycosyltransferase [Candidatus Microgenomates bacterium]|nr:MAG: glycosyltransferase [Candidatus Microgenomates bacterium]